MTKRKRGTFADLYETEQQQVRSSRPGRPRSKKQRKQVTIYLTDEQKEVLADLHYAWNKKLKLDRSDIAGLAIDLLAAVAKNDSRLLDFSNFESLKVQIMEQIKQE